MKKILSVLLILTLFSASLLAFGGCAKKKNVERYDPSKFKETIDLSDYTLVFSDEFDGELNRDLWGDTRQGTRRTGFWTKNLAFTDGEGHLVLRTEKRGSRFCSETREREVAGDNESRITVRFDDCYPFGLIAGDFGELSSLETHTHDSVGFVILDTFDILGERFEDFISTLELPAVGEEFTLFDGADHAEAYSPFFETAAELYSYYSFVPEIKAVRSERSKSALIGVNYPFAMTFSEGQTAQPIPYRAVLANVFGFSSEAEFAGCGQALADAYQEQRENLKQGESLSAALENGAFSTDDGFFIAPVVFRNKDSIVLTYVIAAPDGRVTIWVNDLSAALRSANYGDFGAAGAAITNETYCKNVLFVTGPEGVYSGAVRTLPIEDHNGNVTMTGYTHGYGYYEIRCKLPSVKGIWHAFWMMCGDVYSLGNGSADGVEIDVFEYLPARDSVNHALHWDGYDEAHQNIYKRYEKTNLADGEYHTFGTNWDENGYAFYIDGKKVWQTKGKGICSDEGHMLISTEYGEWGDWVGSLDLGDLPVDWIIDSVKIYDKIAA
ncbi:MAG: glycoside hydrolase family 16 protein [Clostridia bacterium]|nr:glycoside hydrolase family 16 protein [Clostridia bacterium]